MATAAGVARETVRVYGAVTSLYERSWFNPQFSPSHATYPVLQSTCRRLQSRKVLDWTDYLADRTGVWSTGSTDACPERGSLGRGPDGLEASRCREFPNGTSMCLALSFDAAERMVLSARWCRSDELYCRLTGGSAV